MLDPKVSVLTATLACFAAGAVLATQSPLSQATDLGPVIPSTRVDITVWLKLNDAAGLEATLAAQQSGKAAFLTDAEMQARYAPSSANLAAVEGFLTSHGLTVKSTGPNNMFVTAQGTAARVEAAFAVDLHQYNLNGKTFRAGTTAPHLPAGISPLVASVGGLSDFGARPNIARPKGPLATSNAVHANDAEYAAARPVPLKAGAAGFVFSPQCLYGSTSVSFSGGGVTATYQGNRYGADINNSALGTAAPCGYQPSDLQTAYNLTPLYRAGLDGTGQTIAIVDAYGSTTVQADLAAFSQVMGLPAPQLTVVGTPTESGFSGSVNSGWADETTLDVEWVHAVAPGAKILLVVAPTNSLDDLFAGILTAARYPGVAAISNSWSSWESQTDIPTRLAGDQILMFANARGRAVNFATGDSGDETINLGYVDVDYPSSSPYATGIGGVSVALDSRQHIAFQSSWGNNILKIADTIALGSPPLDPSFPPYFSPGFVFGGGGGISNVYPKPSFQQGVPGPRRGLPDISWTADPYTGVEIVETLDAQGGQYFSSIGGTSLACPMFSALWGIATQRAHHPLGQAAPYLYKLPDNAIFDVTAANSPTNVTGVLTDSNGTQKLTAPDLALPLSGQPTFYSALYNSPYSTRWFVLTFGTDSALPAGPGWDTATGVGTPNGWNFVQAFGHD